MPSKLPLFASGLLFVSAVAVPDATAFERVAYNHPGLVVDLGVGLWAWPLPMDYDGDGDHDLVVVCPDVPYSGTYFFENTEGNVKMPVFKPGRRIGDAVRNPQLCEVDGQPHVLAPGIEYRDFRTRQLAAPHKLGPPANIHGGRVRANQWKYCDYDGDGSLDLIVGVGDWNDYGWDDAFDASGQWTRGPLHGFVYLLRNQGSTDEPRYADPVKLEAEGEPIDVFGMPSPSLADFDGDGDLDLICGEFLDRFSYFQNVGNRSNPEFAAPRFLAGNDGPLRMDLQMITPTAIDWDQDGDIDLICGDEDGRVALVENSGRQDGDGVPVFLAPRYFQQEAADVKFGALVTPCSVDWDGDGDEDLICGNTAGYIGFIENLDGGDPPRWAAPVRLAVDGEPVRIMAGSNGSIQGPCEAKWGYTTLDVADWDGDELPDIVVNSIWGKIQWLKNVGSRKNPELAAPQPIEVEWEGAPPKPAWNWWNPGPRELATQWRTSPAIVDWNEDGLADLLLLDHEGYLALWPRERRAGRLVVGPPQRIFYGRGAKEFDARNTIQSTGTGRLRLTSGLAGRSGRRKFCLADWDQDGRLDLLVNSTNIDLLRNDAVAPHGGAVFVLAGAVDARKLAGHTTSPTTVDWDRDGVPDLLAGAEDGFLYYLKNPHSPKADAAP